MVNSCSPQHTASSSGRAYHQRPARFLIKDATGQLSDNHDQPSTVPSQSSRDPDGNPMLLNSNRSGSSPAQPNPDSESQSPQHRPALLRSPDRVWGSLGLGRRGPWLHPRSWATAECDRIWRTTSVNWRTRSSWRLASGWALVVP